MKTKEEREKEFMIGLAKLTRETGIIISGCARLEELQRQHRAL